MMTTKRSSDDRDNFGSATDSRWAGVLAGSRTLPQRDDSHGPGRARVHGRELALWAMFVLTRWRQTQVALSALEEEFRYYLID
jgi:hypothetical protein